MKTFHNFTEDCSRKHKTGALSITIVVTVLGVIVTAWIKYDSQEMTHLKDVELSLTCATCATCVACLLVGACTETYKCEDISFQRRCGERGWAFHWTSQMPKKCASDQEFLGHANKEVEKEYHIRSESMKMGLKNDHTLEEVKDALIDPSRIIFHWFPHCWNREATIGWTNLSDYERDASTYTISTGPYKSCERETFFIIPKTGLYHIYGKITFACDQADHKRKRIRMDVAMIGNVQNESATTLMTDEDENTCWLEGDLLTLYRSGLFRMMKGNRIFLKYSTPSGVRLSSNEGSPFRSAFGAYRVGLS